MLTKLITEDEPKLFGDSMTADTMVSGPRDDSVNGDTCANVIKDRASNWIQGVPANRKKHQHMMTAFQRLMNKMKPQYIYTDNSKELRQAMKRLRILADTSRPHKPQTNEGVQALQRGNKMHVNSIRPLAFMVVLCNGILERD